MTTHAIAAGHNGSPIALHLLSIPLFRRFEFGVDYNWLVETRLAGDKSASELPAVLTWTLAAITPAERQYLYQNILTAASALVTINTPDDRRADSANRTFNATAYRPKLERDTGRPRFGAWPDFVITFMVLKDIT